MEKYFNTFLFIIFIKLFKKISYRYKCNEQFMHIETRLFEIRIILNKICLKKIIFFMLLVIILIEKAIFKGLKAANIVYLCYEAKSDNFFLKIDLRKQ